MISRIRHLQHARLYPSTRVTNTKSMTPNQLRFRASGFKCFRHIPSDYARVSRQSVTTFISLFLLFFFVLLFLFFFFLEDYIGLHTWVTQTYYGSSTGLRSALQGEKRYINSQPIGTIWCAVCELAKGGMFKVENAEISIEQKLNQAWNCFITKITYRVSIFQLKARVDTQNEDTKVICKSVVNCK